MAKLTREKHMIRNGNLKTLQAYYENRILSVFGYVELAEYCIEYDQPEIKAWLDSKIAEADVDQFNRIKTPGSRGVK